ncbi:MAG: hypothetical protein IJI26_00810 [Clostridia bacterium]|nr:hypothetical protein [Clostridia bacterium]
MPEKIILKQLSVSDYIHPAERDYVIRPDQSMVFGKMMDSLSDVSMKLCQQYILGKYVEVTQNSLPSLYDTLKDVCRILGYDGSPRLFITRDYQPTCIQLGVSETYILVPDLIVERGDPDMLYFLLGNAVGMFKGGHLRLMTLNAMLNYIPEALPFRLALQGKQRAADLSSDRAGLLACQNYSAAARAILWDMGMPPEELMSLSDDEMLFLSEDYDQELKNLRQDIVEETASTWDKWIGTASPGFVRLRELYTWYRDGYRQLLDRFVTSM